MPIEIRETKDLLESLGERLLALRGIFDIDRSRERIAEIDRLAAEASFWNDQQRAQALLKEQAGLRSTVEGWERQQRRLEDARVLLELAAEADDAATAAEAAQAAAQLCLAIDQMELARMLSGEHDRANALLSINAGAGGVDAQDWAEMLCRMYLRWCERRGYAVEELDHQPGEDAGIKSATYSVKGEWAYGYLRAESGVHRLVRISPFDANARRHTAFAAVFVYPEIDDSIEVDIREEDLEVQTMRSGGAGGQHVNKTESAVRIIHKPTGLVAKCQSERSQHKNRSTAMKMLRAMLYAMKLREQEAKLDEAHSQKKSIEWGSQIRSYVLAPYRLVTDHRTELKVGDVDAVLDGEIDAFIKEYLISQASRGRTS
ncbi:MAG: peptide chain release factor 2 [Myxococcota bacterium]|nr:peptide chain release factor 2 [Myxococcota bacterium]